MATGETADVVIVGGGIVGCTTAYNLARRGARVILFEKGDIAQEASGRNRGNVRLQLRDRLELPIVREAIELWKCADDELGLPTEYRTTGNLLVTYHEEIAAGFEAEAERHRGLGIKAEVVSHNALRDRVPDISSDILAGFLTTEDGHVNPQKATWAFATAARRAGAQVRTGTAVTSFVVDGGKVLGVNTDQGTASAPRGAERGWRSGAGAVCAAGYRDPHLPRPSTTSSSRPGCRWSRARICAVRGPGSASAKPRKARCFSAWDRRSPSVSIPRCRACI